LVFTFQKILAVNPFVCIARAKITSLILFTACYMRFTAGSERVTKSEEKREV